jgi:fimbrial isopeptide formation D2 family protein/LPXTG-motif cell wall-anchored protein
MLATFIAIVMSLTMGGTALAAGTHYISLASTDTHEYKVYQVLIGTLDKEGSYNLGNPAWGAHVKDNVKATDVNVFINNLKDNKNDQQKVANLVYDVIDLDKGYTDTVTKDNNITGLETGYYILVDVTDLDPDKDGKSFDTQALHVVEVLNDIKELAIKWGTTQDDKTILSDTLYNETADPNPVNGDVDNVSVGDTVNYQITATIPSNANLYNYFYFVINDNLDKGLTLDTDSIMVYMDSVAEANLLDEKEDEENLNDYILKTVATPPCSFQVGLVDAKALAGHNIIVTYSAVLNKDAEIGETPNKNTSTVTYSNNPNHDYDGENNPGFPASTDDTAMGKTPVTETETYTTGIEIQKVDENGNVLTGATFELSGASLEKVLTVAETFTVDNTDGVYYKLKDGTYTTDAPTATGQYMEKVAGATEGYVIDASYTGDDKVEVGGITYRPYAPATDTGVDVYVLHTGNGHLYDSTETKYKKTLEKTLTDVPSTKKITLAVDTNGLARFDGLGAGTYTITETVTPNGYNTIDPFEVTVTFNADNDTFDANNDSVWTITGGSGAYNENGEGVYKVKIQNNKGTQLPSTGGIGTTIFYVVGGIMVAGAVVFLLTKRRIAGNE